MKQIRFNELVLEWLSLKKLYIKHSTYVKYENMIYKHILPYFENIDEMNNQTLFFFFEKKKNNNLSSSSLNTLKSILSSIFKYANDNYNLPSFNLRQIKIFNTHKTKIILSNEERNKILDYILKEKNALSIALLLALYGGLRLGEICALKWKHFDFKRYLVTVEGTATRLKCKDIKEKKTEVIIQSPKSNSSCREVPLPEFVFHYMKKFNQKDLNDYILSNNQQIYEPRRLEKNFHKFCNKENIKSTFHNLRHTYATECVRENVEIKTLSEILGHSNVSITLNLYVHTSLEQKQREISKIKTPIEFVD